MPHLCVLNQTLLHRSLPPNHNPAISRFSDRPNYHLHRLILSKVHHLWLPHHQIPNNMVQKHRCYLLDS
ncbi:hypothetical protein HanPSC8_Chr05g0210791 [Helianthus annuus]|nr:hypothetical protein HanPSC8_Chr05g0210791 [Helianthus annuus]